MESENDDGVRLPCSFSLTARTVALFAYILRIPLGASVVARALQRMVLIP